MRLNPQLLNSFPYSQNYGLDFRKKQAEGVNQDRAAFPCLPIIPTFESSENAALLIINKFSN